MRWRAPLRGHRCAMLSRFARLEPARVLTLPQAIAGIPNTKKAALLQLFFKDGGEGGIRTLDTLPYTHFPGVLLQPLGHLTVLIPCLGRGISPFFIPYFGVGPRLAYQLWLTTGGMIGKLFDDYNTNF